MNLMILDHLFKKVGIRSKNFFQASNGLEAYKIAESRSIDLIVMDLNMPVMGGFEATKKIKDYFNEPNLYVTGRIEVDSTDSIPKVK
mmetsp:Transcript_23757/g.36440  ORF Transcript_23757/g.36440 Transcript_23757/m.36440 type:complete len:87 (-) Transcript_23757:280-540(-)